MKYRKGGNERHLPVDMLYSTCVTRYVHKPNKRVCLQFATCNTRSCFVHQQLSNCPQVPSVHVGCLLCHCSNYSPRTPGGLRRPG